MTAKSSKRAPQGATANTTATNGTHLIGYARVSSGSQDTTVQEAMLRAAGCTVVRTEKVSGRSREGRSELEALMDFIRPGDSLVVAKLDRLGRSTRDVLNLVHKLEQKGANLRVLEPAIDTGGPMGKMVLAVLAMVAEMGVVVLEGAAACRHRGCEGKTPCVRSSPSTKRFIKNPDSIHQDSNPTNVFTRVRRETGKE
jgi:hypothetical protein